MSVEDDWVWNWQNPYMFIGGMNAEMDGAVSVKVTLRAFS